MTMDYSPWVEREIWPFLRVAVSPKLERSCPPKLVYMHVTSRPNCMNFLSRFRSIKFFDDHGHQWVEREIGELGNWSMGRKGNLTVFEGSSISETGEVMPTKIGVYAFDNNPYLHKHFGLIPID